MKIPKLDIKAKTLSTQIWDRFVLRYGITRAKRLVSALGKPVKNFTVRVSTNKISKEVLAEFFESNGWRVSYNKQLEILLNVKTKGPHSIPYYKNAPRMIIDKIAAENVFIGSDLFGVGILRMPKFNLKDTISLISPKDQIVAVGTAHIDSKTPKSKGLAVKNNFSFYNTPSIRNLGLYESGQALSQSLPACYVAYLLEPSKNDVIVDLCAAPGGKSTTAAILSNNKAKIVAFDRSKKRLSKMKYIIAKQNLSNIEIIRANSISYVKKHTVKASKVIVDPSCSAIGVRPKIYESTSNSDIINASKYQKSFLWAAAKIVRKGGIITYSTCTTEPEENEKNIAYAVKELNLKLVEPNIKLGTNGEDTNDGLELEYMRRFYPDTFDTPGFFVAKLMKL